MLMALTSHGSGGAISTREWGGVRTPTPGPSRAIGETSAGCLSGGVSLPEQGTGYQVMHLERNRYYGHAELIRSILNLARVTAENRWGELHVGDLAQPRGGPMAFGHRSHQTGLDVDIWFNLDPDLLRHANGYRSNIPAPSLLTPDQSRLNRLLWDSRLARVLETASRDPRVDRIFVHAQIKRELCRTVRGDRSWLRKIRPWYRHDDHFHLRLACPADSPECIPQAPLSDGEGCDASLDWWLAQPPSPAPPTRPPAPPAVTLPYRCRAILSAP